MSQNMNLRIQLLTVACFGVLATVAFVPEPVAAQETEPTVYYACYMPEVGVVYRIKEEGLPEACLSEEQGEEHPGITTALLKAAFTEQVQSVVSQLRVGNAGHYLELPEGVTVQRIRPIEQTVIPTFQLLRAS